MTTKLMEISDSVLERLADILRVLAHPDRLRILEILEQGDEVSVGQIEILIQRPQSVVSQHLGRMKRAGLLASTRSGKNVCYRLHDRQSLTILNCIRKKACIAGGEEI